MPELPDLQIFSGNLKRKFANKRVKTVRVFNDKKLNVSKEDLIKSIEGGTLKNITREGKELHFAFENSRLGLHLMLKGQLNYLDSSKEVKHKIIEMVFEDGSGIVMSDFMGQAVATLNPSISSVPDALSDDFNFTYLKQKLSAQKGILKAFLLDQKSVRGIGNAYVDEILYDCKVSPFSVCNKIPDDAIEAILASTKRVLNESIDQIQKTNPEIISGEVRDFFKIHSSSLAITPSGEKIQFKELNGKKTYFIESQILYS